MNNIHRKTTYCKKLVACFGKYTTGDWIVDIHARNGWYYNVDAHYIEVRFLIIPPCKTGLRGSIIEMMGWLPFQIPEKEDVCLMRFLRKFMVP